MSEEPETVEQEQALVEEVIAAQGGRQRAEHLSNEEMNMAALAHASVVLGFVTSGLAGIVVALLIWLSYKDRSDYVATQSLQAVAFQLLLVPVTIVAGLVIVLSALTVCLIPLALLLIPLVIGLPLAELVYGLYAAYQTYYGVDFDYWLVGEFVRNQLRGTIES
jgi:uncharacterized Tic20 family protein